MTGPLRIETDADGIATITLNRPDKHHALDAAMISALTAAAVTLGTDPAVRAVVLAATGPSFCAGGDLAWMRAQATADSASRLAEAGRLAAMFEALDRLPKPLLARVQGNVYGGGIGLLAVADIAIAAEGSIFALTETRLGLVPATIGPFVVARMGRGMARQVFFTGAPFGTDFALRSGLVHEICPADRLDERIRRQTDAILATAPGAVATAKALCRDLGRDHPTDTRRAVAALAACWADPETQARIRAFLG